MKRNVITAINTENEYVEHFYPKSMEETFKILQSEFKDYCTVRSFQTDCTLQLIGYAEKRLITAIMYEKCF